MQRFETTRRRALSQEKPPIKLQILSTLLIGEKYKLSKKPPGNIKEFIKKNELEIVQVDNGWFLCSASEERLKKSLEVGAVLVVNEFLLMKFIGKPSALCVRNTKIGKNIFKKGYWYSPYDKQTRDSLRDSFDRGEAEIHFNEGKWIEMRKVEGGNLDDIPWGTPSFVRNYIVALKKEKLINKAEKHTQKVVRSKVDIPDEINDESRYSFRERWKESH